MDILYHPAFQSLVLPLLLALVGITLLRALAGRRWAPLGAALGLLAAMAVWPGFDWPALSRVQKLPWAVLGGAVLATAWLRFAPPVQARHRMRGVVLAACLTIASLGLAAFTGIGGSLLLAQLALMVATTTAVLGLWSWWRPGSGLLVSAAALLPMALAWLVIATTVAGSAPAQGSESKDDLYYTPKWE